MMLKQSDRAAGKETYRVDVVAERRQTFHVRARSADEAERIAAEVADFGWQGCDRGFAVVKSDATNTA